MAPPRAPRDALVYDSRGSGCVFAVLVNFSLGGFGLINFGLIDTHVDFRGRQGRDIALMIATDTMRGVGIDQNSAVHVIIDNNQNLHVFSVLGENGASFYDISELRNHSTAAAPSRFCYSNIVYHYLTSGDFITYSSSASKPGIVIAECKEALKGKETRTVPLPPSQDIFSSVILDGQRVSPREYIKAATNLVNTKNFNSTTGNEENSALSALNVLGQSSKHAPFGVQVIFEGGVGYGGNCNTSQKMTISLHDMQVGICAV